MKTLIVNFFGGPGTGKSKMAFRLTSDLKEAGFKVDMAPEYAKDMVWQESMHVLANQRYIFGKQQHRIWRLYGKVNIIVTDSSLLNSLVYGKDDTTALFKACVVEEFLSRDNLNINLLRGRYYDTVGRNQDLPDAIKLDIEIAEAVQKYSEFHATIPGELENSDLILKRVIYEYNKLNNIQ